MKVAVEITMQEQMEVNAAIRKIIANQPFDLDAARIIIAFGKKLPPSRRFSTSMTTTIHSSEQEFAHIPRNADQNTVPDDIRVEKKTKTLGTNHGQIGYYKIWRISDTVYFCKLLNGIETEEHALVFDTHTDEPLRFGIIDTEVVFSFLSFKFLHSYLSKILWEK